MKIRLIGLLALLYLLAPVMGQAAPNPSLSHVQNEVMEEEEDYSFRDQILNMVFALTVIVGLVVLAAWLMRRLSKGRLRYGNHAHHIKVIERRPLAPKTTLYLLEIAGQGVVIADAPGGVRTLYELPPETKISNLSSSEERTTPAAKFIDIFQKKMDKKC